MYSFFWNLVANTKRSKNKPVYDNIIDNVYKVKTITK